MSPASRLAPATAAAWSQQLRTGQVGLPRRWTEPRDPTRPGSDPQGGEGLPRGPSLRSCCPVPPCLCPSCLWGLRPGAQGLRAWFWHRAAPTVQVGGHVPGWRAVPEPSGRPHRGGRVLAPAEPWAAQRLWGRGSGQHRAACSPQLCTKPSKRRRPAPCSAWWCRLPGLAVSASSPSDTLVASHVPGASPTTTKQPRQGRGAGSGAHSHPGCKQGGGPCEHLRVGSTQWPWKDSSPTAP